MSEILDLDLFVTPAVRGNVLLTNVRTENVSLEKALIGYPPRVLGNDSNTREQEYTPTSVPSDTDDYSNTTTPKFSAADLLDEME